MASAVTPTDPIFSTLNDVPSFALLHLFVKLLSEYKLNSKAEYNVERLEYDSELSDRSKITLEFLYTFICGFIGLIDPEDASDILIAAGVIFLDPS